LYVEDVDGYQSYYDEEDEEYYVYNEEHGILFWFDDDTHHLVPILEDGEPNDQKLV
jgi:hypothetical protein